MSREREMPESELLKLLAKGDQNAFDKIYFHYSPAIYSSAVRFLKDDMKSKDLVQELFTKLWMDRQKFEAIQNLRAYLLTMSRNLAIRYLREIATESLAREQWALHTLQFQEIRPEDRLSHRELEQLLNDVIALLPPQQRKVYYMARIEGLTYSNISDRLNISTVTVKQHMIAANRFVRERISRQGDF